MKEVNYDELNRIRELSGTLQESWQEKMQGRPMPFPEGKFKEAEQLYKDVRKGSDWFRKHNPEAYMVLID